MGRSTIVRSWQIPGGQVTSDAKRAFVEKRPVRTAHKPSQTVTKRELWAPRKENQFGIVGIKPVKLAAELPLLLPEKSNHGSIRAIGRREDLGCPLKVEKSAQKRRCDTGSPNGGCHHQELQEVPTEEMARQEHCVGIEVGLIGIDPTHSI
jgi:hypothetical protein